MPNAEEMIADVTTQAETALDSAEAMAEPATEEMTQMMGLSEDDAVVSEDVVVSEEDESDDDMDDEDDEDDMDDEEEGDDENGEAADEGETTTAA